MLQVFLVAFTKQMYLINRETQGAFQRWDSWGSFSPAQLVWAGSQDTGLLALLRSLPALAIPGQQAHLAIPTSGAGLGPSCFAPPH